MKTVTRFWIMPSDFTDVDYGMCEWSNGEIEFATDILKDTTVLSDIQRAYLYNRIPEVMIGLSSIDQIYFMYLGVVTYCLDTDEECLVEEIGQ